MTQPSFRWTVLVTCLAFVVAQLDVSIINLALPQIAAAFHAGIGTLQWIVDAYTLAFAVLMLSAGSLGDRLGSKHIYQVGMIVFGLASLGCALAPEPGLLVFFRVVQGIGASMMIPSSLALLNHRFAHEPEMRTKAIGLWTAAGSAAMAAGPTIGGLLIELANWRFIFLINLPICLAGYLMSLRLSKDGVKRQQVHFDVAGQILWAACVTALIASIIQGPKLGFDSMMVIGGLIFSLLAFAAFVLVERKALHPVVPLHLFASGSFNTLLLLGAVLNGCYYGSVFVLSLYVQQVLHYRPFAAGLAFLPLTVGFVISNVASARILNAFGTWKPILAGLGIFALGFAGLFILGEHTPYWQMFLPFLMMSGGMGLAVPAMINGILSSVDKKLSGTASALLTTTRQTAGAIGVAVIGIMATGGSTEIIAGISRAAATSICLILIAIIAIARLYRKSVV
jgi:DHA2 family methylenomycin A resistance protein-like MFS transporter